MSFEYKKVTVGGTFDHLHTGHQQLLDRAFAVSEFVAIGITTPEFVSFKPLSELILPFEHRKKEVETFLRQGLKLPPDRYQIVVLKDLYGTTLQDKDIEALVVTQETLAGAVMVNNRRVELSLPELPIVVAEMVNDRAGGYISSTKIRQGLINRQGEVYRQVFTSDLRLTPSMSKALKKPMDRLHSREDTLHTLIKDAHTVAVVGDITLGLFIDKKLRYEFGVFDAISQRKPNKIILNQADIAITNASGILQKDAVDGLYSLIGKGKGLVKVVGEEDLFSLVLVLALPLKSLVVYGQPGQGIVSVEVTEESKDHWYRFLQEADRI